MALSGAEKQAAYRRRRAGLQVTVMLTPAARVALDKLVESGKSPSQAISEALTKDGNNDPV